MLDVEKIGHPMSNQETNDPNISVY